MLLRRTGNCSEDEFGVWGWVGRIGMANERLVEIYVRYTTP